MDRVTWPFEDVVLPSTVLPILHASLDGLFSGEPLATGVLHSERIKRLAFLKVAWGALESAEGELKGEGALPELGLRASLVDRTELELRGVLPEVCRIGACFTCRKEEDSLHVDIPDLAIDFQDGCVKARSRMRLDADFDVVDAVWPRMASGSLGIDVLPGSSLPFFEGSSCSTHPLVHGSSAVRMRVEDVAPSGGIDFEWGRGGLDVQLRRDGVGFEARVSMPRQDELRLGNAGLGIELRDGIVNARLKPFKAGLWRAIVRGGFIVRHQARVDIAPVPELHIDDPALISVIDASASFDLSAGVYIPAAGASEFRVEPKGRLDLVLQRASVMLDGRRLDIPEGASLSALWRKGQISSEGLGAFTVDLGWDLHDRPIQVSSKDGRLVTLDSPPLRRGRLAVNVSPGGRTTIVDAGNTGATGIDWMTLLVEGHAPSTLGELAVSGEGLDILASVLELFDNDLSRLVVKARDALRTGHNHFQKEGIRVAGDAIPRVKIANLISRFMVNDTSLATRLEPMIRDVTEGRGINLRKAKALVADALPDLDADYEVDRVLRFADLVVRPGKPHSRTAPVEEPPIDLDPRFFDAVAGLPSASEIYSAAERLNCSESLQIQITGLAPELSLAQLDWVLQRISGRWEDSLVRRLKYVRMAKRAVARIDAELGALAMAAQSATVGGFLGSVIGPLPDLEQSSGIDQPACALGPVDVAVLFQAGLSDQALGLQSQLNNRLLLELVCSRPGDFLRAVLVEMSQQTPRILAGVLMAFLNQGQRRMKEPLDIPALVSDKLGLHVPRLADYMAGGRHVRASYYEALSQLADQIIAGASPYLVRRAHLREVHHVVAPPLRISAGPAKQLESDALAAVAASDRLARRLRFDKHETHGASQEQARLAYRDSFAACAAFLNQVPTGFMRPWMKDFWRRNEEALKVLSVVRNVQQDVDDVRGWMEIVSGAPIPKTEAELVDAVIDTIYAVPEDRAVLKADPLVRLLVEQPEGRYDLTIVSAMGVITDGAKGRELEDAYRRLGKQRGVQVVRANTGLFKSLEFNASAILRAISAVDGPWAWIGYSQGCANGLLAESFLRGGTPDQQKILGRFVGRNLLFSASNGSVHGTCGTEKMLRAMVEGERFLKTYQASYSRQIVDLFLRSLQVFLDSRLFVEALGGAHSLTLERAIALHRDGQFVPWVPTSSIRGQVSHDRVPELLEWLYFMHEHQVPGLTHDTQVPIDEAVGHATRVRNKRTDEFARCDIGSFVQATHHWSPLTAEIETFTTPRDRALAIYQGPKDFHVFPWIETLARFGRIRQKDA
jgi:hypothetical protein